MLLSVDLSGRALDADDAIVKIAHICILRNRPDLRIALSCHYRLVVSYEQVRTT